MAQLAPGNRFRFEEVDVYQARVIRADYEAALDDLACRRTPPALIT
jgi:allophanate hydrolase subunit 2